MCRHLGYSVHGHVCICDGTCVYGTCVHGTCVHVHVCVCYQLMAIDNTVP